MSAVLSIRLKSLASERNSLYCIINIMDYGMPIWLVLSPSNKCLGAFAIFNDMHELCIASGYAIQQYN